MLVRFTGPGIDYLSTKTPSGIMNSEHQAVIDAALALPEAERALLTERLLDSLSPEMDEVDAEELFAELNRRRADLTGDPSIAIPWSDIAKEQ
jgi:putative addiction module component (TIGR02574 family)